jgi:hypothetical protein
VDSAVDGLRIGVPMPYREIIAELEARRKQLEEDSVALEAQIEAMKVRQVAGVVKDDTRIISGVDVKEPTPAE